MSMFNENLSPHSGLFAKPKGGAALRQWDEGMEIGRAVWGSSALFFQGLTRIISFGNPPRIFL